MKHVFLTFFDIFIYKHEIKESYKTVICKYDNMQMSSLYQPVVVAIRMATAAALVVFYLVFCVGVHFQGNFR